MRKEKQGNILKKKGPLGFLSCICLKSQQVLSGGIGPSSSTSPGWSRLGLSGSEE